ncbi:MAG: Maf family nucleotide pyrophosphatase [Saprospiraceae bacterium]
MNIILASNSPRRKALMKELNFDFSILKIDVDEEFSPEIPVGEVAEFLAKKKFDFAVKMIDETQEFVLITADTVVICEGEILGKPANLLEGKESLRKLSGKVHSVITGVCIGNYKKAMCFSEETNVKFKNLNESELEFYINNYNILDKAGAYAIKEWIGLIGVEYIEGSYTNVMGLPSEKVFSILKNEF